MKSRWQARDENGRQFHCCETDHGNQRASENLEIETRCHC